MAGRTHTKPGAGPGGIGIYRILASLAPARNDHFTALQLPSAITIDAGRGLLILPYYDGEDLAARWHESDDGASPGTGLAARIPVVLQDLAAIDTAAVTTDPVLSKIPGLGFDHAAALRRSAGIAREAALGKHRTSERRAGARKLRFALLLAGSPGRCPTARRLPAAAAAATPR